MSVVNCIEAAWQFAALVLAQSTLLIVGVYLMVKLLRLSNAALLSVIYRSALIATVLAPLATCVMIRSEIVGWWPWQWSEQSLNSIQSTKDLGSTSHEPQAIPASQDDFHPFAVKASEENVSLSALPDVGQVPETASEAVTYPEDVSFATVAFCVAWACCSTLFFIRLWRAHRQLCRTLSKAVPVESSVQAFCDRLAAELKVSPPRVVCSPFFSSPFLAGVLHPVVHLSSDTKDDLGSVQTDGLRDILIHELAHLKRRDVLMRMTNQLVLAAFFFQPLLWRLSRWLERSAEDVCDDYAMSFGARRDHYAGRLVDLAERCDFPFGSAVAIASGKSALEQRVVRIMDSGRRLSTTVSLRILAVCGLTTAAAIATVCLLLIPAGGGVAGTLGADSDSDDAFRKMTALDSAVHKEERDGLIFAIHQAKRFENGGVLIMSTVRGTDKTLEQYPLRHLTDGPATNYEASPQGSGHFRLMLAETSHQGIDAQWWMMVPRGELPTWFEDKDGKVQLELGITPQGEYARENHADERGVIQHIYWKHSLHIPKPDQLPSLDEIATSVHSDLSDLGALPLTGRLNMGVVDVEGTPTSRFGSASDVSVAEFAKATLEHWQWWDRRDLDFQIRDGATSGVNELGGGMRPAVMVDYNTAVDDATLARASERSDLAVISARGTKITDAGLAYLKTLNRLKKLNIANTSITDSGLQHLEALKSLEHVNLAETSVTEAGIERLRKSLPNLVVVTENVSPNMPKKVDASDTLSQPLPPSVSGMVIDSEDQPIPNAKVTVLIRTFAKEMHEELNGPQVWTALTDDKGRYAFAPAGTVDSDNEVRIKVVADGFADVSDRDYEKKILTGTLPSVRMSPGRRINGRLVSDNGAGVASAIVRFQSCNENLSLMWDSGPFPVDPDGRFSLSIPVDGKAAGVIYPTGYAPRFVDVIAKADQGDIVLEKGVTLRGRVIDKKGQGVARTVVGIEKTENRILYAYVAIIGTAVKTDESGNFQLPPLSGRYQLSVEGSVADYSRQMVLNGETPPTIKPMTIEFDSSSPAEVVLRQEQTP